MGRWIESGGDESGIVAGIRVRFRAMRDHVTVFGAWRDPSGKSRL